MADNIVRNIAPFINDRFLITSPWWTERINPITGETQIHRGLDIATSGAKPVYSILDGIVHSIGYDNSQGNWIVIKDNNPLSTTYGYATLYMHLADVPIVNIGDSVQKGQEVGTEGTTGSSTGIHLHIEMQDLNRWNNVWHWSYIQSDYINPCEYMGIDNIDDTWWIYDGIPKPTPVPTVTRKRKKFPWAVLTKKIKNKRTFF